MGLEALRLRADQSQQAESDCHHLQHLSDTTVSSAVCEHTRMQLTHSRDEFITFSSELNKHHSSELSAEVHPLETKTSALFIYLKSKSNLQK